MEALKLIQAQAEDLQQAEPAMPYSTRGWGEISRLLLPDPVWFLGRCFALGYGRVRLQVIFGQGGLGKSRIALNIARNQVLGIPFGGMSTGEKPLRHLFMGTENGLHRLQSDIRKMSAGLSSEEMEKLSEHIFLATLEQPDDPYVTLGDPDNVERWRATIEQRQPDVLWADPWGDVQSGDSNSETDARWTVTELTKIMAHVNPNGAIAVLAHSRTGVKNIMEAVGYDGANFGKGSKALYSCARAVLNLAPGGEDENPPVVVACAKNNDGPKPEPLALQLDPESMTYELLEGFDVAEWVDDIRHRASGKRKKETKARMTEEEAMDTLGAESDTTARVRDRLRDAGASRDVADDLLKRLLADGRWESWRPRAKNAPTYVGCPGAIEDRKKWWVEKQQKKLFEEVGVS